MEKINIVEKILRKLLKQFFGEDPLLFVRPTRLTTREPIRSFWDEARTWPQPTCTDMRPLCIEIIDPSSDEEEQQQEWVPLLELQHHEDDGVAWDGNQEEWEEAVILNAEQEAVNNDEVDDENIVMEAEMAEILWGAGALNLNDEPAHDDDDKKCKRVRKPE